MTAITTCEELYEHVNTLFENQTKTPEQRRLASNGEPFYTFCSGGIKKEGDPHPARPSTEQEALDWWVRDFFYFAVDKGATKIYWRRIPEFIEVPKYRGDEHEPYVTVYSRLLLE